MKTYGALGGIAAVLVSMVVACGEDDPQTTGGTAGKGGDTSTAGSKSTAGSDNGGSGGSTAGTSSTAGSAGSANAGTGGTSAGAAGDGGAGGAPAPTFQSKPAGIELVLDAASQASGLTITSTSIVQDNDTDLHYTEWLGELHNGSDEMQCLIAVSGDFQTAAGVSVIKLDTYAYGAAHDLGTLTTTSPCAAPGESVPLWSNAIPEKILDLPSIKKLVVSIEPLTRPEAVLHPSTPTITPIMKTYSDTFGAWQLSTTATATADIYNASLTFWGKAGGFIVGDAKDFHLDDFPKGSTWAIDTAPLGIESPTLDKIIPYFSFIDGLEGAARRVYDAETTAVLDLRSNAKKAWDANRARREQRSQARGY